MSDQSGDHEDKTEEPTEKKLRDAHEKGDLPRSREALLFSGLLASLVVVSLMLRPALAQVAEALAHLLDGMGQIDLRSGGDVVAVVGRLGAPVATLLIPIFLIFIVAGIATSCAQAMPSVVLDRIMPDLSKISPMKGFGRLFSGHGLIESGKGVGKLIVVGVVVFILLRSEQTAVIDALFMEPAAVPDLILGIVTRLLAGVATAFGVIAVLDFLWTKTSWRKRQRMTRQEVKDEMRQAEGDPILKAKRRSLQLDRSRRRMMADVPRATVVIANPTHFAIALRYVRAEGGAPVVVAKGKDLVALKIREIAEECGVAVIENKLLARSMYDHVEVAQVIPPEFYKAVAEIIHYIQSRAAGRPAPRPQAVLR
ncbi:flagellar biosynthesis protein FlhB [Lichenihabitans sp. Uapishka_5]|uniref:flagellar biosynthesis protein FlhB n=1 Tax=Lichenihabitans sp. Uapishka_5 TaxID=3037302 RepID=UPI0029E8265C|nr:flagellar biosynthesis protein FlhB [Lichenihabitans sp. Uapishka_5]MDX7950350.1 flagellar biosynthesis protein FlhB [Lichenihabitans sp. Uapishka_5]